LALITKYGSLWGAIPQTSGRVFWVAPSASYTVEGRSYSASDSNDGLSPERALLTLGRALDLVAADVSDVIVLLPGTHTLAAQENIDVAGITITGLPGGKGHPSRQRAALTSSAADEVISIGAARVELAYLHLIAVTQQAAVELLNAGDYAYIHDCSFDMFTAAAHTSTMGIMSSGSSGGVTNLRVENCYFETLGAQGPYLKLDEVVSSIIEDCTFRHRGSTALADGIVATTGAVDIVVRNSQFIAGTSAVITDVVDWTGNTTDGSLQLANVTLSLGGQLNASADADILVDQNVRVLVAADGASLPVNHINAA